MRVHDQFCTDYEYNIISIPQTYVEIDEDQVVKISNEKKSLTRNLNEATYIMNQIEDDETIIDDFEEGNNEDNVEISDEEIETEMSTLSPEEILDVSKINKPNNDKENEKDKEDKENNEEEIQHESNEIINDNNVQFVPKIKKGGKLKAEDFDY